MSPLPNVKPLKPEFGSVINDATYFQYPISIPACLPVSGRRNIFIAVISASANFEQRAVIRRTWAMNIKVWNQSMTGLAGFAFILGQTKNNVTQTRIASESRRYKDIIQIDMDDFYRNLPLKYTGLLNWLHRHCSKFIGFIFKVDDDVYVNLRSLEHFVHYNHPFSRSMFGLIFPKGESPPQRGMKLFL
jgi:hypothetical protein